MCLAFAVSYRGASAASAVAVMVRRARIDFMMVIDVGECRRGSSTGDGELKY